MKKTMYPARLELEILREQGWVLEVSYLVNNDISLFNKYQYIKSMYPCKNKSYQIVLIANSKVNGKTKYKEGDVETPP
jgi:hypothetical protein